MSAGVPIIEETPSFYEPGFYSRAYRSCINRFCAQDSSSSRDDGQNGCHQVAQRFHHQIMTVFEEFFENKVMLRMLSIYPFLSGVSN